MAFVQKYSQFFHTFIEPVPLIFNFSVILNSIEVR